MISGGLLLFLVNTFLSCWEPNFERDRPIGSWVVDEVKKRFVRSYETAVRRYCFRDPMRESMTVVFVPKVQSCCWQNGKTIRFVLFSLLFEQKNYYFIISHVLSVYVSAFYSSRSGTCWAFSTFFFVCFFTTRLWAKQLIEIRIQLNLSLWLRCQPWTSQTPFQMSIRSNSMSYVPCQGMVLPSGSRRSNHSTLCIRAYSVRWISVPVSHLSTLTIHACRKGVLNDHQIRNLWSFLTSFLLIRCSTLQCTFRMWAFLAEQNTYNRFLSFSSLGKAWTIRLACLESASFF